MVNQFVVIEEKMNCSAIIRLARNPKMKVVLESCLSFSFDTIGVRLFTGIWFFTLIFLGEGFLGSSMLAQGTAFLYQGRLNDGGQAANGFYDLQFAVFDAATNGNQVSPVLTNLDTYLTNGYFQTALDFGNIFEGDSRWLQIGVRTNGTGSFALLQPLQQIMAVPYAQFAGRASNLVGVLPSSQLSGTLNLSQIPSSLITNSTTGLSLSALLAGNGAGLTNILASSALVGQWVPQNDVLFTVQTNGSNPFYVSTNWFGLLESQNTAGDPHGITNSSFVSLYCGLPTNYLAFGYMPGVDCYTTTYSVGIPAMTPSLRFNLKIFGNKLGLWMQDGGFFYIADSVPGTPQNWSFYQHLPAAGDQMFYTFTWPNVGFHTFSFEMQQGTVVGLFVPVTNNFVPVAQPTLKGFAIGDSITGGAAGYSGHQLWPGQIQDTLLPFGINILSQGEGGTGYIETNINGTTIYGVPFIQRLTNTIVPENPQFVIWAGGINDPTNGLFEAATNCYGTLKSLLPNCKQLVIASWGDMSNPSDETNANIIISNAAAVYGLPVICPDYSADSAWITGNFAVPGSGNAPVFWSGNGPHPNALGHAYYSKMVQNFILTNLLTKGAPVLW